MTRKVLIALIVAAGVAAVAGIGFVIRGHDPQLSAELVNHPWVEQRLGELGFAAPWKLDATPQAAPDNIAPMIKSSTWLGKDGDGLWMQAMEIEYNDGVPVSLDGAANGAINNMRALAGIASVDAKQTPTRVLQLPGIDIDAQVMRDNKEAMRFRGLVLVDHQKLYMLLALSRADQPAESDRVWTKLVASIKR